MNSAAASSSRTTFILAHGSWHGAWCWERVTPHLVAAGHSTISLDFPGHGLDAKFPKSYNDPLDAEAFATEPSFIAEIPLSDFIATVTDAVDQAKAGGADRVVVVGHSMGGVPITFAGEEAADKIDTLIFLTACMGPPNAPYANYFTAPEQEGSKLGDILSADPAVVGAFRWNPASKDPAFLEAAKGALVADGDDDVIAAALNMLTPDAPVAIYGEEPALTVDRYGSIDRVFIKCSKDYTLRPALQDLMISDLNAAFPDKPVRVFEMQSSHEPMLSQPKELAEALMKAIA
ncbi:MAG: alpha/beta fold hydrolase [Sulfitobacter sp.]